MRVHHLNAATMRPAGTFGGRLSPTEMVAHTLVVERPEGLLLVDTTARGEDRFAADVWEMLNTRCLSIAGGTTQILRNVAGERILGLPR